VGMTLPSTFLKMINDSESKAIAKKKWMAEYYLKNKERIKARSRDWAKANPELSKARAAAWHKANRDKANAKRAKWDKDNPEKARARASAWARAWAKKNPEKAKERARNWHRDNRDKSRACSAAYAKANPEIRKIRNKAWMLKNPERASRISHTRRARKIAATIGNTATIAKWEKSWRNSNSVICYWCGSHVAGRKAHLDHIQPLSKGGSHSIENLCVSCAHCNLSKKDKSLDRWNAGLVHPVLF